jgi:hypothetical protein
VIRDEQRMKSRGDSAHLTHLSAIVDIEGAEGQVKASPWESEEGGVGGRVDEEAVQVQLTRRGELR